MIYCRFFSSKLTFKSFVVSRSRFLHIIPFFLGQLKASPFLLQAVVVHGMHRAFINPGGPFPLEKLLVRSLSFAFILLKKSSIRTTGQNVQITVKDWCAKTEANWTRGMPSRDSGLTYSEGPEVSPHFGTDSWTNCKSISQQPFFRFLKFVHKTSTFYLGFPSCVCCPTQVAYPWGAARATPVPRAVPKPVVCRSNLSLSRHMEKFSKFAFSPVGNECMLSGSPCPRGARNSSSERSELSSTSKSYKKRQSWCRRQCSCQNRDPNWVCQLLRSYRELSSSSLVVVATSSKERIYFPPFESLSALRCPSIQSSIAISSDLVGSSWEGFRASWSSSCPRLTSA